MTFKELLKEAGLKSQKELGEKLGMTEESVSRWNHKLPRYAEAYLELLIEYNRVRP